MSARSVQGRLLASAPYLNGSEFSVSDVMSAQSIDRTRALEALNRLVLDELVVKVRDNTYSRRSKARELLAVRWA